MAPRQYLSSRKVLVFYLVLFVFACVVLCASSETGFRSRGLDMVETEEDEAPKKKPTFSSTKNQTKLAKSGLSAKNQTKLVKTAVSLKNQTKLKKPTNSTKEKPFVLSKAELKKLNSTSQGKKLNSTSKASGSATKKSTDLIKLGSAKNKTTKAVKKAEVGSDKNLGGAAEVSEKTKKKAADGTMKKKPKAQDAEKELVRPKKKQWVEDQEEEEEKKRETAVVAAKKKKKAQPGWVDQEEDEDLVSEFRDLPMKFQQTLIPDLEKISTTSKAYLNQANKEIARGVKAYVGHKYASTIASAVSFAFILIPLILVSLIFNRIKAYFSIQKILIFVQVYLSIYFSILCLTSVATGLEPLRFFYSTSQSTYVCLQVLQTLGYVLYLLLLLMYLILVFSTETGVETRLLGLGQTFVGFAVGLHYYVAVFHRVVLHQPPRTNWKIHGIYAVGFLAVCLFSGAQRRKKAYMEDSGEEGKLN